MSVAAGPRLHKARQFFEDENEGVRNGGANKIVFPFASVHVCTNFYCKRDGKCRKVQAWVYNLREKVSENSIPLCQVKRRLGSLFWFPRENIGRHL